MKYISLSLLLTLVFSCADAQLKSLSSLNGQPVKTMTVAEANQLNGTANPMINGISYSEYKLQQDVLKKKREQQLKAINAVTATVSPPAEAKKEEPVQPKQKTPDPNILN